MDVKTEKDSKKRDDKITDSSIPSVKTWGDLVKQHYGEKVIKNKKQANK